MIFFSLSGAILTISSLLMSVIMLISGRKIINIFWFFLCISMSLLGIAMIFIGSSHDPDESLLWWRIAYIGIINTPFLVLKTTYLILSKKMYAERVMTYLLIVITIIFHILNFSGKLIDSTELLFGSIYFDIPMSDYSKVFLLYFNGVFSWIFIMLFFSYREAKALLNKEFSQRILFFAAGIGAGAIGGYSLYLPLFGVNIYPYASILMGLYPVIIAYAILRHHLFDARYAILQIIRVLSIGLVLFIVWGFLWVLSGIYLDYIPAIHPVEITIWLVLLTVALLLYHSRSISGLFLMSSLRELEREVEIFLDRRGVYQNHIDLLADLEKFFSRGLKIKKISIINSEVVLKYPRSVMFFQKYKRPLVLSELEGEHIKGEMTALLEEVRRLGEVVFPIEQGQADEILFLVLGKKDSERTMTEEELRLVGQILPKLALSLQVLKYHQSLQEEVRIQTKVLHHKNKELQEVDHNKDNFLAIASHELRTPMTIIKGYSDLFLKDTFGSLSVEAHSYMQKIYDNTESLIELVNNILDISKIEAGRFEIIRNNFRISESIKKCIDNFETLYTEKGISLILTNTYTEDIIYTDESKFILICNNLLSNAYKFTNSGGQVNVGIRENDGRLEITVSDTGSGIEKERLGHIFEKFNQADNTNYTKKSIHGTGLGLYLCKQIIELLGGAISVSSEIDKGSIFTFYLPINHDTYKS